MGLACAHDRQPWRLYAVCGFVDALLATFVLAAPERALLVILAGTIFCLWLGVRVRPSSSAGHIRVAATAALISALILAATTGMSWLAADAHTAGHAFCFLGGENDCARSLGPFGGDLSALGTVHALELSRWHDIGLTARAGVWLILFFLVPAAVCLMIEPENRYVQAVTMVGGFLAATTGAAALAYRLLVPPWIAGSPTWSADVAVLAAGTIAWSAAVIAVCALSPPAGASLPVARLTRSRR
ncbi:MAG TPA: hypothetical protein VFG83_01110 [Kofleriaceae bacterium]|nr:hypothetical protein [Kofleriaceae bacterium]